MKRHRVRDLGLEVLAGLAVVAAIIAYAEVGPFRWMPGLRWWGFIGETVVLFGYVARAMRPYWKTGRFWTGFLAFFAAHLAICVAVLLKVEQFGLLWFVFIGYAEWLALAYLLAFLLREDVRPDPSRCRLMT